MRFYTLDSETDPFKVGRDPQPFCWGLWDGERFRYTWGANCTDEMIAILWNLEPGIIYLHNGGKFDIFYLLPAIDTEKEMLIIKDRITQCFVKCRTGYHRLRDSLKILPFALETYKKTKIDYTKFEADVRESHKVEIVDYLKDDCIDLYELVAAYIAQFGLAITIGSTAMKELKKFHNIGDPITGDIDASLRSKYYFGARVERYQTGVLKGDWKCYDVNSMYPFVMANVYHPIGAPSFVGSEISTDTYLLTVTGYSRGAFPLRCKKRGVIFPHEVNTYSCTIHEFRAATELGLFDLHAVNETVDFKHSRCFTDYVMHYYNLRKKARLEDDKIREIFYKFLLNNSYGKFAINPENFKEYRLTKSDTDLRWFGFDPTPTVIEEFDLLLWSKPSAEAKYNNIATGASITGAARAVLMRGIHSAVEPVYCDTDSIICKELGDAPIDVANLGAWKLEKTGNMLAIGGRKMYALFQDSVCVKYACKGVKITPEEIVKVASGDVVTYEREAPTYRLNGNVDWITRKVRIV